MTKQVFNKLKKYKETYRLLEEYDKKPVKETQVLANAGRLLKPISRLQRSFSST